HAWLSDISTIPAAAARSLKRIAMSCKTPRSYLSGCNCESPRRDRPLRPCRFTMRREPPATGFRPGDSLSSLKFPPRQPLPPSRGLEPRSWQARRTELGVRKLQPLALGPFEILRLDMVGEKLDDRRLSFAASL